MVCYRLNDFKVQAGFPLRWRNEIVEERMDQEESIDLTEEQSQRQKR